MKNAMFGRLFWVPLVVAAVLSPGAAHAQDAGLRVGVSGDPDQFYFGGHLENGPIVEDVWFRPNVEIGVGQDLTLIALNFEFTYTFPRRNEPWGIYVGGGPAVNIYSFGDEAVGRRGDQTDVEGGFNILFGVAHRDGLFVELKIGALDSPDLKFGVGYTFR